jgi:SRSO17 transposase
MVLPIITAAPLVVRHAQAFRDVFENRRQFEHFQNYLTGLMVLDNKSLSNMSRCLLESADKTNLSRFLSQAPWEAEVLNDQRVAYMIEQTTAYRVAVGESCLLVDDTLCEHVGTLFEYVARHYDHCENRYPLAHNLVTSHFVSGAVRFPVDCRMYRRWEEMTRWEEFVHKHFPDRTIPTTKKERAQFRKEVNATLFKDAEFAALDAAFRTKIDLAVELVEAALGHGLPFKIVLMDSWYLSAEVVAMLRAKTLDWVSLLKKNRNLETASFTLRDTDGQPIVFAGPHVNVETFIKHVPKTAFRRVRVGETDYWTFALNVRVPDLGKVRLVVSFTNPDLTGTCAVLVSNRTDWSAEKLITTYLQRWPIETFYQDGKGHLGLDEYRMRSAEAIQKHWCLVFVAYSFLHLDCLQASPTKRRLLTHPVKTIGEACRNQGQAVIQNLILTAHKWLQTGKSTVEVFAKLFAKHQPVMTC